MLYLGSMRIVQERAEISEFFGEELPDPLILLK
jgi:hypothetical protein